MWDEDDPSSYEYIKHVVLTLEISFRFPSFPARAVIWVVCISLFIVSLMLSIVVFVCIVHCRATYVFTVSPAPHPTLRSGESAYNDFMCPCVAAVDEIPHGQGSGTQGGGQVLNPDGRDGVDDMHPTKGRSRELGESEVLNFLALERMNILVCELGKK